MTNYFDIVFSPLTLEQAKQVVLTSDPTNPNKFNDETRILVNCIIKNTLISSTHKVLDFGCGMGRVSKELINQVGCEVIGLDQSIHMQLHAIDYVDNSAFDTCTTYNKSDIDVVLSILVLQHVQYPTLEIHKIYDMLVETGILITLNEPIRYVPIGVDQHGFVVWNDDGEDIDKIISSLFRLEREIPLLNNVLKVWTKLP